MGQEGGVRSGEGEAGCRQGGVRSGGGEEVCRWPGRRGKVREGLRSYLTLCHSYLSMPGRWCMLGTCILPLPLTSMGLIFLMPPVFLVWC